MEYYQTIPISQLSEDIASEDDLSADIQDKVDTHYLLKKLTPRQQKIVKLKDEGYNNIEIAGKLKLNERTIRREMSVLKRQISIID